MTQETETKPSEQEAILKKSGLRETLEIIETIVIVLLLFFFIRTFVIQAFKIPSGSMEPTLLIGDQLLVNKFIYGVKLPFTDVTLISFCDPEPNDIIVFRYPKNPDLDYIKRVIATGGETVEIRNKKVFVNGRPFVDTHGVLKDPNVYAAAPDMPRDNFGPVTVPEGKLFVMGDNRDNSADSRFWGFVDLKEVVGKAWIIYWSWNVKHPLVSPERLRSIRWSRMASIIY